ncbi:MAG: FeoB small GTPase domain-containing protein, partial [Chitinophagaceae bacterium]
MRTKRNIALVGNPNSGKSSLFNLMTGLDQKIGNFPGVTVEKRTGNSRLSSTRGYNIIDLPGSYSIYPRRADESVSYVSLMDPWGTTNIDTYVVVTDASNIGRNLLYVSQIIDLGKPVIVALTMMDILKKRGSTIDIDKLSELLGVPLICINPRLSEGIELLDATISNFSAGQNIKNRAQFIESVSLAPEAIKSVQGIFTKLTDYGALQYLMNHDQFNLSDDVRKQLE